MSKYLDIKKLKYVDNIVEIDDEIADTILQLNRKGYNTYSCCSGHSKIELYTYELPLDKKDEALKKMTSYTKKITLFAVVCQIFLHILILSLIEVIILI